MRKVLAANAENAGFESERSGVLFVLVFLFVFENNVLLFEVKWSFFDETKCFGV